MVLVLRPLFQLFTAAALISLSGCAHWTRHLEYGPPQGATEVARASATVSGLYQGSRIYGQATLVEFESAKGRAVRVVVWVRGMPRAGKFGVHIHARGNCASSGEHFDPVPEPQPHPQHAGDLPNMEVDGWGEGILDTVTDRFTLTAGPRTLFDADGSTLVIHEGRDFLTPDRVGERPMACGVIQRSTRSGASGSPRATEMGLERQGRVDRALLL